MDSMLKPFLPNIQKELSVSHILSIAKMQSLWSDYGGIFRLNLKGAKVPSVVVKCILLEEKDKHPRGWVSNLSHERKVKSYQVENHWYEMYAASLPTTVKVPQLLYREKQTSVQILVLEDLSHSYPNLKQSCTYKEAKTVIRWLAQFHAHFINSPTDGLWPIGSYWHLNTRPDEWKAMEDSPLKEKAQALDFVLNEAKFQTIIHGDAKVANFCFSNNEEVAAVDFQYVGKGVGVKDFAYFLGSCFSDEESQLYEGSLLEYYFETLKLSAKDLNEAEKAALEKEWRELYPIAWADFNRFLLGWLPNHQKLHNHALSKNGEAFQFLERQNL
ncbi:phosphotransferase [Owenweeksia hongkongensis]|uniref:phosphotransferase n=1 Tax=Owenweeksia hongkongensis TaxID=253245 RepID=UPI003A92D125